MVFFAQRRYLFSFNLAAYNLCLPWEREHDPPLRQKVIRGNTATSAFDRNAEGTRLTHFITRGMQNVDAMAW